MDDVVLLSLKRATRGAERQRTALERGRARGGAWRTVRLIRGAGPASGDRGAKSASCAWRGTHGVSRVRRTGKWGAQRRACCWLLLLPWIETKLLSPTQKSLRSSSTCARDSDERHLGASV